MRSCPPPWSSWRRRRRGCRQRPEGVGAAYNVDSPVDEVPGEVRFFGVLRGCDEAEARYEDDPGVRVSKSSSFRSF
jgi:hypothetical protein